MKKIFLACILALSMLVVTACDLLNLSGKFIFESVTTTGLEESTFSSMLEEEELNEKFEGSYIEFNADKTVVFSLEDESESGETITFEVVNGKVTIKEGEEKVNLLRMFLGEDVEDIIDYFEDKIDFSYEMRYNKKIIIEINIKVKEAIEEEIDEQLITLPEMDAVFIFTFKKA
ncbi:MAG: lipocalin family protein [Firmicutes bacterium]|nr:lipocalin family protein [Bacillota bacterium]